MLSPPRTTIRSMKHIWVLAGILLCTQIGCQSGNSLAPGSPFPDTVADGSSVADASLPADASIKDASISQDDSFVNPVDCPTVQPAEGDACQEHIGPCDYGAMGCVTNCACSWDGTHPPEWHCILPVGPSCPATTCPEIPPANQTACGTTSSGALFPASGCFYEATQCKCDCWTNGNWDCVNNCSACPANAPVQDDACSDSDAFAVCQYGATNVCTSSTCSCQRRLTSNAPLTWDCYDSCEQNACPPAAPSDGAACEPIHNKNLCIYSTAPYCGVCQCAENATWNCSASNCDQCPAAPPVNGASCQPANEQCQYSCAQFQKPCSDFFNCMCDGVSLKWLCY